MLVCGRPELTALAIKCYESQTYESKELISYENAGQRTIGALRNAANALVTGDIVCHFDTDDFSHQNRIAEQVALLQSSGADVVGYNQMLFWRTNGEAWLYSYSIPKPTLGTSLMYWRKTWEQRSFNPKLPNNSESTGEDWDFIQGRKVAAVSALVSPCGHNHGNPRMIARIHGANSTKYNLDESRGDTWKRVPEWDEIVREILK
jgi:hypothetical protein